MTLVYPGSFDPVTLGHIDIATRGAKLCTRLIVAVLDNPNKNPRFSTAQRTALLEDALGHITNIEIAAFSGLLVDFAKSNQATAILRGLRSASDAETEARYAASNAALADIDTVFLAASPQFSFISSSIVREAAFHISNKKMLHKMVTPTVAEALTDLYNIN